jgi:transcriptional regulator of acetoin/glycerol metabolism
VVLGSPPTIEPRDLPRNVVDRPPALRERSLAGMERAHIGAVLQETGWNISQSARILEIDRGTLYHKIEKYELEKPVHGR